MMKEFTDEEIINRTMRFLVYLHKGENQNVRKMCDPNVLWKYMQSYSDGAYNTLMADMICQRISYKDIIRLVNTGSQIKRFDVRNIVVTGTYSVESKTDCSMNYNYFDYTVFMVDGLVGFLQIYEISSPPRVHKVIAVNGAVYNFDETMLLYVESIKDHILWHYGERIVETVGTLKKLEEELSEDFIRVHRSYIVNKKQVFSIQRYSVTVTNGDNIPIPYKRYVKVRELLTRK